MPDAYLGGRAAVGRIGGQQRELQGNQGGQRPDQLAPRDARSHRAIFRCYYALNLTRDSPLIVSIHVFYLNLRRA